MLIDKASKVNRIERTTTVSSTIQKQELRDTNVITNVNPKLTSTKSIEDKLHKNIKGFQVLISNGELRKRILITNFTWMTASLTYYALGKQKDQALSTIKFEKLSFSKVLIAFFFYQVIILVLFFFFLFGNWSTIRVIRFSVKREQFLNKSLHLRARNGSNRNTGLLDTNSYSNDSRTTPWKWDFIHRCGAMFIVHSSHTDQRNGCDYGDIFDRKVYRLSRLWHSYFIQLRTFSHGKCTFILLHHGIHFIFPLI